MEGRRERIGRREDGVGGVGGGRSGREEGEDREKGGWSGRSGREWEGGRVRSGKGVGEMVSGTDEWEG